MQNKKQANKMSKKQKEEHAKNMAMPINQFMNATDEDGKIKYPVASKLRNYWIADPDAVLNDMRLSNSLLHELRWHKENEKNYMRQYDAEFLTSKNKDGNIMTKEECYLASIKESHTCHIVLSKLRALLSSSLLSKCDREILSFEQYNEFVTKTEEIVAKAGFTLFPDKVELIEPL